ncbi:hypothetical protein ACHAW5_011164 [Stephanodiscus triporus]|uniref:D-xylose 1-dehydrogenase (NADP(+), D-xylono-1,5-lactone-forming) n=1 Tax=Stephanodiscus triporus TaxID=2934178 RepID=A0ABD3MS39_9STRA
MPSRRTGNPLSVVACLARSLDNARKFADKHGIRNLYGSYNEMVRNEDVNIIYVGNLHAFRRETAEKCLAANEHVVVEKPFACNVADGEYLLGLAKERDRFIMEGMWMQFLPVVEKARELMFGTATMEPALGEIAKLWGGTAFVLAPYPIAAATLCFRNPPDAVEVIGQKDEGTGVDIQGAMILSFPPTGNEHDGRSPKLPGAGIACLSFGFSCETVEETSVVGSKGRLKIETPCHCPTKVSIQLKAHGRGHAGEEQVFEYPLPVDAEEIKAAGGFEYPNSAGFVYKAAAVARCMAAGNRCQYRIRHAKRRKDFEEANALRALASPRQLARERAQRACEDGLDNEAIRMEEDAELYRSLRADATQDELAYDRYLDRDEWYEHETRAINCSLE